MSELSSGIQTGNSATFASLAGVPTDSLELSNALAERGSPLDTAHAIWFPADFRSSPRHILNRALSRDPGVIRSRLPNGPFRFSGGTRLSWHNSSCTVTEAFALGPDGQTMVDRVQLTGGAASSIHREFSLATGNHTAIAWVRSLTGLAQNVRLTMDGGSTFTAVTIPATGWTQLSATINYASAGNKSIRIWASATGGEDADFALASLYVVSGNSATGFGPYPRTGALLVGNGENDTLYSVTSGVLNAPATHTYAHADLPPATATNFTVMVLSRKTTNAAGTSQEDYTGTANPYRAVAFRNYENGGPVFQLNSSTQTHRVAPITAASWASAGWHFHTQTVGGFDSQAQANRKSVYFLNGAALSENQAPVFSADLSTWQIGPWSSGSAVSTEYAAVVLWRRALTPAEVRLAQTDILARLNESALAPTMGSFSKLVIHEGDAIPLLAGGYPEILLANLTAGTWSSLRAQGGSQINGGTYNMTTRRGAILDVIAHAGPSVVVTVHIGADDLATAASTTAWLTSLNSYVAKLRTHGAKVAIGTVLPKGTNQGAPGVTHNSRRAVVNAELRGWVAAGKCDAVVDYDTTIMGSTDAIADNLTYYSSGIHPTVAGHVILEPLWRAAVNSL